MKKSIRLIFILSIVFGLPLSLCAQHPHGGEGGQSASGGASAQTVTSVSSTPFVMIPDPAFTPSAPIFAPPADPSQPAAIQRPPMAVIAPSVLWSTHVKAYILPASYSFTPNLRLEADIPYLEKTLKGEYTGQELKTSGWGDAAATLKWRFGNEDTIQGITHVTVKFPTGDERQFEGRQERLALGTGSYDFMINQTASKFIGKFRVLVNLGYRFNTAGDYTETNNVGSNIKYENRAGNMFNYLVGLDYYTPLPGLVCYLNAAGVVMGRSKIKETDVTLGTVVRDGYKTDRLSTLDLNPGVRAMFTPNIGFRLGVIIPTWTEYDPDITDKGGRDWMVDFGLVGMF